MVKVYGTINMKFKQEKSKSPNDVYRLKLLYFHIFLFIATLVEYRFKVKKKKLYY